MDTDRITGAAKEFGGKAQSALGSATGNYGTEAEGRLRELQGKGQNAFGQAKEAASDAVDAVQGAAKDAADQAGSYVSQTHDKIRDVAGSAADSVRSAYDNASDYASQAQETARKKATAYAGQARDAARSAADTASGYAQGVYNDPGGYLRSGTSAVSHKVEENPLVALLVAGAVGYGLALLIHGRN